MQDFYFLKNNLFTTYTLEVDFKNTYPFSQDLSGIFTQISTLYDKQKFASYNEAQMEKEFIAKVLEILDWHIIPQEEKIIQGKIEKPDWLLFADSDSKNRYQAIEQTDRRARNDGISVVLESKAYDIPIDNKKVKDNPHFQLLRYLNNLKINFGFLSNGRFWRFYDNTKLSAEKIFYEIDLEAIIEKGDLEAFKYFYFVFNAQNFAPKEKATQSTLKEILEKNISSKTKIEDDLKSLIYGTNTQDSVFEKIGSCIYEKNKTISLEVIYENTLYFMFRLLFIGYFEDKFSDTLVHHKYFNKNISLHTLLENLSDDEDSFDGFVKLQDIFRIYEKGEPNYDMPIFNGGLFDAKRTEPLSVAKIFSNKTLKEILEKLFYYDDGKIQMRRDYRTLSISHLGTIYEGLLAYFFEVSDKEIYYIEYAPKDGKKSQKSLSTIEGYYDNYEYSEIKQKSKIVKSQYYASGQIYLKNTSNSRKSTASYYTPESLTSFLVKECLEGKITQENILTFKILDNACGSGHFLIEALNFVTLDILGRLDDFKELKAIYEDEKKVIIENTAQYIQNYQIDEADILKRLLLKRMIYGVDINPFSIELTKLSLWIDSFIFGTPLSFIEHHIKCGNSLIGTSISGFKNYCENKKSYKKNLKKTSTEFKSEMTLFMYNFLGDFDKLSKIFEKLDSIKDSTEAEILESKKLYREEISPELEKLNLYLNYQNAGYFLTKDESKVFEDIETGDIDEVFASQECVKIINFYAQKYRFFNYEIEFPEIVTEGEFRGFQAIIGNPPWDKTQFSDNDFFPQYQSNYRTLSNSKKLEFSTNLLANPSIKQKYEEEKANAKAIENYHNARYPLNGGQGNLFRFFLERNLSLLEKGADLGYVLPSAIMFEEGSKNLRKHILQEKTLQLFYSFENREGIFPDVHRSYKFALMKVHNHCPPPQHIIRTMFYQSNVNSIYDSKNIIPLDLDLITSLSPEHLALPELRGAEALSILSKCYRAFPSLSLRWLDFRFELNMTNDKCIFKELKDSDKEGYLPLYEGKMIHQFDCHFGNPSYYLEPSEFDERLKSKEIYRLKQDLGINQKEYEKLVSENNLKEEEFIRYDREFYRLIYRDIASDTNERTGIFSLSPKNVGCGGSLWSSIPKRYESINGKIISSSVPHSKILFALGVFNSIVFDFLARHIVQIHLNKAYLVCLPLPQPNVEEIENHPIYKTIALNALKLQLSNNYEDFEELAKEFGISKSDLPLTKKLYDILRAKNDIAIAKLYGLTLKDMQLMLESFKVLCSKQIPFVSLLTSTDLWNSTP